MAGGVGSNVQVSSRFETGSGNNRERRCGDDLVLGADQGDPRLVTVADRPLRVGAGGGNGGVALRKDDAQSFDVGRENRHVGAVGIAQIARGAAGADLPAGGVQLGDAGADLVTRGFRGAVGVGGLRGGELGRGQSGGEADEGGVGGGGRAVGHRGGILVGVGMEKDGGASAAMRSASRRAMSAV
jgi:hypothetical protein